MNIFVLYAPEDAHYWQQLQKHLAELQRQNVISTYHEGSMSAGSIIAAEMQTYLDRADMVLLLVSPDFIASDRQYHYAEQAQTAQKRIVPIIVRPCMWQDAAWGKFAALPTHGKAISQYNQPDDGFFDVAQGLRKLIEPDWEGGSNGKETSTRPLNPNEPQTRIGRYIGGAALVIGILAGLAELSGYSLRDLWDSSTNTAKSFPVSVYVHGTKGKTHALPELYKQRKVVIQKGSFKPEVELIDDKGVATFEIDAGLINQTVHIDIFQETENDLPYKSTHPDSLYTLSRNGQIYLEVILQNNNRLFGTITDAATKQFLPKVRIAIRDLEAYTNQYGYFELQIPPDYQKLYQSVTLSKKGYQTKTLHNIPINTLNTFDYQLLPNQ